MKIDHGVLCDVWSKELDADGTFIIPNGVTKIGFKAFDICHKLTSITIPDGVTSIGTSAFADCINLTSITISDSVTDIEACAFFDCFSLKSITIGNGVTSIGACAFSDCSNLTSIKIPNSVTSIGKRAFEYCKGLTSVAIPNSVTRIGERAFYNCTGLTSKRANYKAFALTKTGKLKCRDKFYSVRKKSKIRGVLELCVNGIHYCTNLFDIFNYYHGEYGKDFVIGVCDVSDENVGEENDSKRCARWVKPTRILTREEVIKILNGDKNDEN